MPTTARGSCQPLVLSIRNSVDSSNFSWNDKKTRQGKESSILTRSCLNSLSADNGLAGCVIKCLSLYQSDLKHSCLCIILNSCFDHSSFPFCLVRALLRTLHLYNIERFDNTSLCQTLSACPNILDLEVVGL